MAKFLTTEGIVENLGRIIAEADKELVLISPYISADDKTKGLLKNTKRATSIYVIHRKPQSERNRDNVASSFDMPGVKVSSIEYLHAKCYLNEKEALVTSMNLYARSQENNHEMGILVSKQGDSEVYEDVYREATRLIKVANREEGLTGAGRPTKLYVGNLSFQATDDDLQELFQQHGEVTSTQVVIDRYSMWSRGFGFVEMSNGSEAETAISALNGREHLGRQIIVQLAQETPFD